MAKSKYYVVWKGVQTGVFDNWAECELQIKGFVGARYKSFTSNEEAVKAFRGDSDLYIGKPAQKSVQRRKFFGPPLLESLSVDAACSGNPGILEYRGVDTKSGIELFRKGPFPEGTVNIGEFLALAHGIAYLKKINSEIPVYSDSVTAMKWVRVKAIKTKLERSSKNDALFDFVDRALAWLKNNTYKNKIIKWETSAWGEIPADFGRK